jgi:hypothetical protein
MGPRGFWIALAIVLAYLIARPHVGTVWYIALDPNHGLTWSQIKALPDTRFTDKRDCFGAELRFQSATGATGTYCASKNALLWGW